MSTCAEQDRAEQGTEPEAGSAAGMHGRTVLCCYLGMGLKAQCMASATRLD